MNGKEDPGDDGGWTGDVRRLSRLPDGHALGQRTSRRH